MRKLKLWGLIKCVNCSDLIRGRGVIEIKRFLAIFILKLQTSSATYVLSVGWFLHSGYQILLCHSVFSTLPLNFWSHLIPILFPPKVPSVLPMPLDGLKLSSASPHSVVSLSPLVFKVMDIHYFITSARSLGAQWTSPLDLWLPLAMVLLLVELNLAKVGLVH